LYDDQREVHRQIFEGDETNDYAFMGQNPDAADNRWLREAFANRIPSIYFLGIAPGRYQAILPAFISGWDAPSSWREVTSHSSLGPKPYRSKAKREENQTPISISVAFARAWKKRKVRSPGREKAALYQ